MTTHNIACYCYVQFVIRWWNNENVSKKGKSFLLSRIKVYLKYVAYLLVKWTDNIKTDHKKHIHTITERRHRLLLQRISKISHPKTRDQRDVLTITYKFYTNWPCFYLFTEKTLRPYINCFYGHLNNKRNRKVEKKI